MGEQRLLITGGTSGIGLATACRFAERGASVAILARKEAGLRAAQERTAAAGARCLAYPVDVTDREALETAVGDAAEALGGLDAAVANVGASTYGRFRDTPAPDFDRVLDVSFRSIVDTVRVALPHLEESGGSLVVVGSLASGLPLPRMSAYTAAKHAVRGFVETLRIELEAQDSGVSLSLVEPGPVDTPFWDNVASADGILPPSFPFPYGPEEVAIAIDDCVARRTRRATVGGEWALARAGYRAARPLAERALGGALRLVERGGGRGRGRAAIWEPSGAGDLYRGMRRRPSLLVRARHALANRRTPARDERRGGTGIDGICEMTLETRDPDGLARFYVDLLGCERVSREDERIWLSCGTHTRLGIWSPGEKEYGDRGGRHVHFALSSTPGGLDSLATRLRGRQIEHRGPVSHKGGDRSLYLEDPEGNVVEIWDFFEREDGARHGVSALG
ncbi:MAG TPA: SDR family NAD(P)-dependent oxidoreductase [Solirubrobacterales bacterium]|nr:SDR family NAD(P)-dependent oxidoreductase [Solirubrobacterales bacterium]